MRQTRGGQLQPKLCQIGFRQNKWMDAGWRLKKWINFRLKLGPFWIHFISPQKFQNKKNWPKVEGTDEPSREVAANIAGIYVLIKRFTKWINLCLGFDNFLLANSFLPPFLPLPYPFPQNRPNPKQQSSRRINPKWKKKLMDRNLFKEMCDWSWVL